MRSSSASRVSPVSAIAFVVDVLALDHGPQDRDQLEILAGPNLQEDVGGFGALGFADIDQHHRAVLAAAGQELALLHDGVLGEMPRMALRRIAAPVHDEVGSVLDFAERTRDFATQLGGDFGWTVSQRGVTVDQAPNLVGQRDTLPSGLRRSCCSCRRPAACRPRAEMSAAASIASSTVASSPSIRASG